MSTKMLIEAIGKIDDKYVEEYKDYKAKPTIVKALPYATVAACALLAVIIGKSNIDTKTELPTDDINTVVVTVEPTSTFTVSYSSSYLMPESETLDEFLAGEADNLSYSKCQNSEKYHYYLKNEEYEWLWFDTELFDITEVVNCDSVDCFSRKLICSKEKGVSIVEVKMLEATNLEESDKIEGDSLFDEKESFNLNDSEIYFTTDENGNKWLRFFHDSILVTISGKNCDKSELLDVAKSMLGE